MPARRGQEDKTPRPHIPRPPNAFILFRSSFIRSNHVPGKVEGNHSTLSKIIGLCWKALPAHERRSWEEKARIAQAEHRMQYPDWRWTPEGNALGKKRGRKAKEEKGKAKEREGERSVQDDDARVAKIADLVREGKTGAVLEQALHEWQAAQAASASATVPSPLPSPPGPSSASLPADPLPGPSTTSAPPSAPPPPSPPAPPANPPPFAPSPRPAHPPTAPYPCPSPFFSQWWPSPTTDGLGYDQDPAFDRDYAEQFAQPRDGGDAAHWTRNPGRNGVCTVITDPLSDTPTTPPQPIDLVPPVPYLATSESNFIPSTYSSLTGWAGDYTDHPAASSGWFGSAWHGPHRPSSWAQPDHHKPPPSLDRRPSPATRPPLSNPPTHSPSS